MLHPQAVALCETLAALPTYPVGTRVGQDRAEMRAAAQAVTERLPLDHVSDVVADGVGCRLYRPYEGAPIALYVHGGGWVLHDLETHDVFCRFLSDATGWALLAVDYRRAPEHPYPAPLDDVQTVALWIRAHAAELGVEATVVAGIGDSSGANLIAGLLVRDPRILDFQVLIYPPVHAVSDTASLETESGPCLDAEVMEWFWQAYAGGALNEPEVSPLLADNLAEHPPAMVITAEHDILRDQGEQYVQALADAGVRVTGYRAPGMVHGFWRQPELFDASVAAVRDVADTLKAIPSVPERR